MAFHRYVVFDSRNTEEALTVFYRLSFAASLLATAIATASHYVAGLYPQIAIAMTPPATLAIYRLLAAQTTNRLWRTSLGRNILGVHTRDISGIWDATITKKQNDGSESNDSGTLHIEQNWRMISITLDTPQTHSSSSSASLILEAGSLRVEYQYGAKKSNPQSLPFDDHAGSATLSIPTKEGEPMLATAHAVYFTNHGEVGTLSLRKREA